MASPLFQVEDQTDEDFFDKLVEDDFAVTESGPGLAEGEFSDEVKAFSNLSVGEVGNALDGFGGEAVVAGKEEKHSEDGIGASADGPEKDNLVLKECVPLSSSNSFAFDNEIETNDVVEGADVSSSADVTEKDKLVSKEGVSHSSSNSFAFGNAIATNDVVEGADVVSDSTTSKNSGSGGASVKEVQWTAFHTGSAQQSGSGFGSYSDFFTELGDDSSDPFEKAHDNPTTDLKVTSTAAENTAPDLACFNSVQYQEGVTYGNAMEQTTSGQDMYDSQYWENQYPGWKYDFYTGEWHQVDGYDATANNQVGFDGFENKTQATAGGVVSDQRSEVSYLQQAAQSVPGTMAEVCTTGTVSNWNQLSQGSTEYPSHMVFDPQYPGWYYDTNAQEWRLLDSYTQPVQSTGMDSGSFFPDKDHNLYGDYGQVKNFGSQVLHGNDQLQDWSESPNNYSQQSMSAHQPDVVAKIEPVASFTENPQTGGSYGSHGLVNNYTDQSMGVNSGGAIPLYEQTSHSNYGSNGVVGFHSFVPSDNTSHQISQKNTEQDQQLRFSKDYYGSQQLNFTEQPFQTTTQHSYIPHEGRSSAGRPPHALVTFGFGGKLIVMKESGAYSTNSAFGSQDSIGGSVSLLKLSEVVMEKINAATIGVGACDYFRTLCQQSFPGPLVGGNAGSKELNKWIDERIAFCESPNMDYRKGELLRLLLSLLKIACQHYGKLRSPFGTDPALKETDCPEAAVAKLFASAKRNGLQSSHYGALTHCLQNMPSEGQIRATTAEVQNLLVSGRTKEALQCAQEGQLWGPALVLAAQLGDQFYVDTVKQMAHRQLVAGSPLRTLCLLIAGQPADVFSTNSGTSNGAPQSGSNSMLDDWEENLAIITANATKGDELVIIHLGDCLLKERGEISAAHTCYLVADANFESYSDSARLCLIGADHWKYPRTYASPEAIQRTELYEYSKVLGNSQSILLPFQPYKLIYAHMLAEVGKVSDSLKYCQAILKSLKTGRAPEVETWKQLVSSLEERIKTHQQGGYGTNLAPAKLVGKLLPFIDSTIHRMIGAPPPPVPSASQNFVMNNEHDHPSVGPRVGNSQSTMAMSSLMPSASMEPISEWKGDNRNMMPNRSISEPDFGRTPRQVDPSKEAASPDAQGRASVSGGPSRFGRFGSQIFQKTMGWVSRSRSDRQAKLGEQNKFYYDEKLKRWVEEGSEAPAEEAALPPPPTTASVLNGMSDYNIKNALNSDSMPSNGGPEFKGPAQERSPGIPPIPPSSNQFSARGRMGVRSRYVDTFNKGGGMLPNSFQSASVPAAKPGVGANAKFFIPTPMALSEQTENATGESMPETVMTNGIPSTSVPSESVIPSTSSLPSLSMQRFPSMGNISHTNKGMGATENGDGSLPYRSRRTASWGGGISDTFNPHKATEIKPLGEALGMPPSMYMPSDSSQVRMSMSGASLTDDLHEVEL
ncbi:protein transport protein SEC16B homolog isoform X2 [Macadamia integrifolia]|uniref:protein transport protein SEC16B homolog isoform X2 n=1 Tax=Macadamia integrifolia TaxID=60698 RepID=UPI001C4FACD6|nr:protein transport protein SEC16B homolog isoform X2 [Macadamia integrifolia]